MQLTGTILTNLVEDPPSIIPVKFGQNPISGVRGEVVDARTDARTPGRWATDNGPSQKLILSTLCLGELKCVPLMR